MDQTDLADAFEAQRPRLVAVARRMLGSTAEADDVVQETWLRLARTDADDVANLGGWLTTVVSRICLDALRQRRSRREDLVDDVAPSVEHAVPGAAAELARDPAEAVVAADAVSGALLAVLETLSPAERLAFVLHDLFGVPFDEVAVVVERSPEATRQLASRARRRVRGGGDGAHGSAGDRARHREVVTAFLDASRGGDLTRLLELLDPDVVLRSDTAAATMGSEPLVTGAHEVAEVFSGRARAARLVTLDGVPGLVWSLRGEPKVLFEFVVLRGSIVRIELVADPARLAAVQISSLPQRGAPPA